jgi:hypothetical protein
MKPWRRDKKFNQTDSTYIYKKYWSIDVSERREKLMPLCGLYQKKKADYGNRALGNKVNNATHTGSAIRIQ